MGKNKKKGKGTADSAKSGQGHAEGEGSSQTSQQPQQKQSQKQKPSQAEQGAGDGKSSREAPPQQQQGAKSHQQRPPQQQESTEEEQGSSNMGQWQKPGRKHEAGSKGRQQALQQQQESPQPQHGPCGDGGQPQKPPQQQQGAWGKSQQQAPPQQQGFPQQQQGAWGKSQQQGFPQQQQQGAWGRSQQQAPPQQQGSPQQEQRAWGGVGQQQKPPQQQQGAWGRSQQQAPPQQQGFPQQQQGAWGKSQQQGFPQQQQRAWGRPQQQGFPQQQGAWGRSQQQGPPQQQKPPQQEQPSLGGKTQQKDAAEEARKTQSEFQFAPRIHANTKSGRPIIVATNFFGILVKNPNLVVYHYNVVIEPDKPKSILRTVWKKFSAMMFPNRLSAFVERNAYSKGPLINGTSCEATVTIGDPKSGQDREFKVCIEEVQTIRLTCFQQPADRMLKEKSMKALPELEISVLEIILKDWAADNLNTSGKCCFFPTTPKDTFVSLSERLHLKTGYFQSVCLGSRPYLNFDVSHKPFYNSVPVLQAMQSFIDRYTKALDKDAFNSFIRTVTIEYRLPNNPSSRMIIKANKLVGSAKEQTFSKDGAETTVAKYFETEKKIRLSHPELPLLWVGPTQKSIYVPVEFCRILPDQVYRGRMEAREVREMVRQATTTAPLRQKTLCSMFQRAHINDHPLTKEFELSVATEMERVPARVLDPPELSASRPVAVRDGVWRIKGFFEPVTLRKWCILNADKQMRREAIIDLQNQIKNKGKQMNMNIGDPVKETVNVDGSFAGLKKVFSQLRDMELVFVIISEAKGLYSRVKTICETQEGVLTQCVKSRTMAQDPAKMATTVENILLKVNAKLGGKNLSLSKGHVPQCLTGYVMVVGADVTHASPGTKTPSVAAVAVSCDPFAFQYSITIRVQPRGEIIVDLKDIMGIHLKKFYEQRKRYPDKIIIFRDGVSEGELPKVFRSELLAVKSACEKLCQPKITFIVVQKRHHARFFPTRKEDEQGRNSNVPVGTCVDSQIVHPRDLDFYLVSHASILGTARPTRYRLLHDDSRITDDEVERLAFYLCHLFARCNRSVSYPSPTYNAHLAAFRARAYLEGLNVTNDDDIPGVQRKITDNISRAYPMFFV